MIKYYSSKLIHKIRGFYPVKIGIQEIKGDADHLFFWQIMNEGGFEPGLFKILDHYLKPDSVYCDIGAWIGPTAIYASKLCKQVIAFEPDPKAWKYLHKNLKRNQVKNIRTHNIAIGKYNGRVKMASHGKRPGDSMSSMINISRYKKYFRAKALTWDTYVSQFNPEKIDLIKMDIEGGEVIIVPTMRAYLEQFKPVLHLSLHPAYLDRETRIERIQKVFDSLDFYREVRDENMNLIDPAAYIRDVQKNLEFTTFVFIP